MKLTNHEKKELRQLFDRTTEPFFKAIQLTNTAATQSPRVALTYVLWEHLAWLWVADSRTKLKSSSTSFKLFAREFLFPQADFMRMLDESGINEAALWTERNKQLHSGRMIPHAVDAEATSRTIFYCSGGSSYFRLFQGAAHSPVGRKLRSGVIDMDLLVAALVDGAEALVRRLQDDARQGKVALKRLRLRGSIRIGDIVRNRAFQKFEWLEMLRSWSTPDVFPLANGAVRVAFRDGEVILISPVEFEHLRAWLAQR